MLKTIFGNKATVDRRLNNEIGIVILYDHRRLESMNFPPKDLDEENLKQILQILW